MVYDNIALGRFIARPNRFIAHVEIAGRIELCHVKNTSRLRELLLPGAVVSVQTAQAPHRKTAWDLIAVQHEGNWVNIDSQAPNAVFGQWVVESAWFGPAARLKAEVACGDSRFDWYIEAGNRRFFAEVKGVTLVEDGVARFPGAPTARGLKHLRQLARCLGAGYEAIMVFVVKRGDVMACAPNDAMDPAFGAALREAVGQGVRPLGLGCDVTPDSLTIRRFLKVML